MCFIIQHFRHVGVIVKAQIGERLVRQDSALPKRPFLGTWNETVNQRGPRFCPILHKFAR